MNIDRGKVEFTPDERAALIQQLREYKDLHGYSWQSVSPKVGIKSGTLSGLANAADTSVYSHDQFAILHRFFQKEDGQRRLAATLTEVPNYQPTPTAKRIHGILTFAQRGKMVAIVGDPGSGKTAAADQYRAVGHNVWKMTACPSTSKQIAVLIAIMRAMGAHDLRAGSAFNMSATVRQRCLGANGLIIVDEAQHLSDEALEEIRAIHDETKVGVCLMGNRQVLTRIEGKARDASFAQLFSRMGMRHTLVTQVGDIEMLLNAWEVTDQAERAFLHTIAIRAGGGALRSLTATLEMASFYAQSGEEERVLQHMKDAWTQLSAKGV